MHYYLLYFAVRTSDQTYCAEYETPVLDEIDDLLSAKDKDVEFVLKGKRLTLRTPKGRKLKAHLAEQKQCCPQGDAHVFGFSMRAVASTHCYVAGSTPGQA